MKITEDAREFAASLGLDEKEATEEEMEEKSEEFRESGSELYAQR